MTRLTFRAESWPIRGNFTTSREVKPFANTVFVEIDKNSVTGRGECFPLKRFNQTQQSVIDDIKVVEAEILNADPQSLQSILPAGPARNAVDCALLDWQAKSQGKAMWEVLGLDEPKPLTTAYTLSLDTPEKMAENAENNAQFKILKMKMNGSADDIARIKAVKNAHSTAQLILDANEAWNVDHMKTIMPILLENDVVLIEQPLPEGQDDALRDFETPIPFAADESCHTIESLTGLKGKYQVVNLKLDKTGGLTHALAMKAKALEMGFDVMVGCMASTSLSILPAMIAAQGVRFVDIDGAYLLESDPYGVVKYQDGQVVLP